MVLRVEQDSQVRRVLKETLDLLDSLVVRDCKASLDSQASLVTPERQEDQALEANVDSKVRRDEIESNPQVCMVVYAGLVLFVITFLKT